MFHGLFSGLLQISIRSIVLVGSLGKPFRHLSLLWPGTSFLMKLLLEDSNIGCLDFELFNMVFDCRGPTVLSHDRDLRRGVWSYADISGCFVNLCALASTVTGRRVSSCTRSTCEPWFSTTGLARSWTCSTCKPPCAAIYIFCFSLCSLRPLPYPRRSSPAFLIEGRNV